MTTDNKLLTVHTILVRDIAYHQDISIIYAVWTMPHTVDIRDTKGTVYNTACISLSTKQPIY